MPRYSKGLEEIARIRAQKREAKAKRLARHRPKWKDERYMNQKEREAYIDLYLELELDEDGNPIRPTLEQVKIVKDMWKEKLKYTEVTADKEAELDMDGFIAHAKDTTESEELET